MLLPDASSSAAEGRPVRVLTYSHDSFGLGHLRRSITLAAAMVARGSQVQALCLTGSPVPDLFPLPERCDLVKLPSIGKDAEGDYVARRLPIPFDEITSLRSDLITATVRAYRPDVLLVDHTAAGPGGELLPVLRRLRHEGMRTRTVLGMRDVLDAPQAARAELVRNGTFEVLRNFYDEILVYGQREVLDLGNDYSLPSDLAARLTYVGAVVQPDLALGVPRPPRQADSAPRLLVTAGGGEDGYDLLRSTLAALRGPLRHDDLRATLVTGPLMQAQSVQSLQRAAQQDPRIELLRSTPGMARCLREADLAIGMGGYNTVYEALATGVPLLVHARRHPRQEQWERCRRLHQLGLLHLLGTQDATDPHRMASAIRAALAHPVQNARSVLSFDGAATAANHCLRLARPAQKPVLATLRAAN